MFEDLQEQELFESPHQLRVSGEQAESRVRTLRQKDEFALQHSETHTALSSRNADHRLGIFQGHECLSGEASEERVEAHEDGVRLTYFGLEINCLWEKNYKVCGFVVTI